MGRTMIVLLILLAIGALTVGVVGCGGGTDLGEADGFVYVKLGDAASLLLLALAGDAPLGFSPLAGATITLANPVTGTVVSFTDTNAAGYYMLQNLAPGTYRLTISAPGYTAKSYNIVIVAGERTQGPGHTQGGTP